MAGEYMEFHNNAAPALNDTNLNALQLLIKNDIDIKANYSTTEKVVGTWIDNKPLYRKVTTYTFTGNHQNEQVTIPHGISNLKMITKFNCIIPTGNGTGYILPFTSMGSAANSIEKYSSQYVYFDIKNDEWGSGRSLYMIFEYTKTTD